MTKVYELVERSGTRIIPVGERYQILRPEVGRHGIIAKANGEDGGFITSPIKKINADKDELIIVTQNTVYTFREVSE